METPIFEGSDYLSSKVRSNRLKFHTEDYSDQAKKTWDDWVKIGKDEAFGFHVMRHYKWKEFSDMM